MKFLSSGWVGAVLGSVLFCAVMMMLLQPDRVLKGVAREAQTETSHAPKPSWEFVNPELQRLVTELKEQKQVFANREQELNELAARLTAERGELNVVTQTVFRMQQDFDRNVLRLREEEVGNLKRLAKIYGTMSPEGAAAILKQMEDDQIVRIMIYMKDAESGPMLENLARLGEPEAKRAAAISERLRNSIKPAAKP